MNFYRGLFSRYATVIPRIVTFVRNAPAMLLLFTSIAGSAQDGEKEYLSVNLGESGKATIKFEKDLIEELSEVDGDDINITYAACETSRSCPERPDGNWTTFSDVNELTIEQDGLFKVEVYVDRRFFKDDVIWEQLVYVPYSSFDEVSVGLAEKYLPVVVFHDDEDYFPQSLEDILDYREGLGETITISRHRAGSNDDDISTGSELRKYLSLNGHMEAWFNFDKGPSTCNENDNDCDPLFLRGSTGRVDNATIYWDASREGDFLYLTYYFFYAFDPKNGPSEEPGSAAHAFDRESFTIAFLEEEGVWVPQQVTYAGHLQTQTMEFNGCTDIAAGDCTNGLRDSEGERVQLLEINNGKTTIQWKFVNKVGSHPVVYIAEGSHAIFPALGWYYVKNLGGNVEKINLDEPAGSISAKNLMLPSNLVGEGNYNLPAVHLEKLEYSALPFMSFSGFWVDVFLVGNEDTILGSNARFPPFIRAPYSTWLNFERNNFVFNNCLRVNCSVVPDYFNAPDEEGATSVPDRSNLLGLKEYRAITVSVFEIDDTGARVPRPGVSVLVESEDGQFYAEERTRADGAITIFVYYPNVAALRVIADETVSCVDAYSRTETVLFDPSDFEEVVFECDLSDNPVSHVPIRNPANGHYYQYVPQAATYADAKQIAAASTHEGIQGHLVTITSASENEFVANLMRDAGGITALLGARLEFFEDPKTWYWDDGPELDEPFWQGNQNGSTVDGSYANFLSGSGQEPDNAQDGDRAAINTGSPYDGRWADGRGTSMVPYVIEYSTTDAPPEPITDTVDIESREWAQPSFFTNLSWNDIASVCPDGQCEGELNGYDLTGWNWATMQDVAGLVNAFSSSEIIDSVPKYITGFSIPDFGFTNFVGKFTPVNAGPLGVEWKGWLSEDASTGRAPFVRIFNGDTRDHIDINEGGFDRDSRNERVGAWFYRDSSMLVAYYPFNGDISDATGNGNDGIGNGGFTYATGVVGQAASLDGFDDYIRIPDSPDFDFSNKFSIAFWTKADTSVDSSPGDKYFFDKSVNTGDREIIVYLDTTDRPRFCLDHSPGDSEKCILHNASQPINVWQHYALTFNNGTLEMYIDGALVDSAESVSYVPGSGDIFIGLFNQGPSSPLGDYTYYDGKIDELRIYSRALSRDEIAELYGVPLVTDISLSASQRFVRFGESVVLSWRVASTSAYDCTLLGGGLSESFSTDPTGLVEDGMTTPGITGATTFQLSCTDPTGQGEAATVTATVRIVPGVGEE